ncbi:uncharacterized protein LOC114289267 [Camellia sinensis]|uniref:uncharacterized protein LOC114289267 n=1 Tax=Camellia sinensis TaxID=4442 RepID=UPI001035D479|nr:uncharacterized protein LOC114289267 [Camellia sinensis]
MSICGKPTYTLVDSGSTHSFVSMVFAETLNRPMETLSYILCVASPTGGSMSCSTVFAACELFLGNVVLYVDVIPLDLRHFDVVLGMDWLAKYYATIDCTLKRVIFRPPRQNVFYFKEKGVVLPPYLISAIKVRKLMNKGCQGYLCSITTEPTMDIILDNIPVVRDFPNVFPNELPGQLVDREIEFTIDMIPGTQPIFKTPYRMSTIEMKKLKVQLQELLDEGFFRPSTSPWGAPILFVKKKDGILRLCIDYRELNKNGKVIAYASRQLRPYEKNHPTHDLELTTVFHYHSGKANTVAEALSRKNVGNLACLLTDQKELPLEFEKLKIEVVSFEQDSLIASMSVQPAIIEEIQQKQMIDELLKKICDELDTNPKPGFTIKNSMLKFQGRLYIPNYANLKRKILEETHNSMFAMHPRNTKMYQDLKLVYW